MPQDPIEEAHAQDSDSSDIEALSDGLVDVEFSDDGHDSATLGDFVVTRGHGRKSCLHEVGRCYRQPGRDYGDFVNYGKSLPEPSQYDAYCRSCWPAAGAPLQACDSSDGDFDSTDSE